MASFLKNLAKAAKEGYEKAKEELAAQQAQSQNYGQGQQAQYGQSQGYHVQQQGYYTPLQQGQYNQHQAQYTQQQPGQYAQQGQHTQQPNQYSQQTGQYAQQLNTPPLSPDNHSIDQHQQQQQHQNQAEAQPLHHEQSQSSQHSNQPTPVQTPTQLPPSPAQSPAAAPAQPPQYQSPSPGCVGFGPIPDGQYYATVVAPDMAVCPSCYQVFVASSPFADRFTLVPDPTHGATCDIPAKTMRAAWIDVCGKGKAATTASDREAWFQHFGTQAKQILEHLAQMMQKINTLKEEIQVGELQAQYAQKSSMMQISHGASISAINSINLDSGYRYGPQPGALTSDAGRVNFGRAMQMHQDVNMKRYELNKTLSELRLYAGVDDHGQATWA